MSHAPENIKKGIRGMRRPGCSQNFPRAVILDLDGTLYPYAPANAAGMNAVREKLLREYGIKRKQFNACFCQARQEVKKRLGQTASSHSRLLYFQRMLELLGFSSQPLLALDLEQSFWRNFLKNADLYPGVTDFLQFLKTSGVAVAIVTDLTAQIQLRKLVYFELDSFIDCIVTSEESGADKAALLPFALALEKLALPPQDIWVIGDDEQADMIPARHFSMLPLLKSARGMPAGSVAAGCFNHFSEITAHLKRLR